MSTTAPYSPRDFRRVCDICSVVYNRSQLRKRSDGYFYCPDDDDKRTAREKDRDAALQRRNRKVVYRDVKPRSEVSTYEQEEGRIFTFLTATGNGGVPPGEYWDVTSGNGGTAVRPVRIDGAAWPAVYLYEVINENKRPARWIALAKTKLRSLADYLLTQQLGNPYAGYNYAAEVTATWYGGFVYIPVTSTFDGNLYRLDANYVFSRETAMAGLALLRAYQACGDGKYRDAAVNAATCMRRMQCGDLTTTRYATTVASGTARKHWGVWTHWMKIEDQVGGGVAPEPPTEPPFPPPPANTPAKFTNLINFDQYCSIDGMCAFAFLDALKAVVGDDTYGDAGAVGDFVSGTAATVSTMLSEAKAFWTNGANEEGSSTLIVGFSSATAYSSGFQSAMSNGSAAAWDAQNSVGSIDWAQALWGWHKVYGYDAKVADIWPWLQTATSPNAPASTDRDLSGDVLGTFNAKYALVTSYTVGGQAAGVPDDDSGIYNWATMGLLAGIQSVQDPGGLLAAKEACANKVHRYGEPSPRQGILDDILLIGYSGLGFQTLRVSDNVYTGNIYQSGRLAAMVGLAYRFQPYAFPLQAEV